MLSGRRNSPRVKRVPVAGPGGHGAGQAARPSIALPDAGCPKLAANKDVALAGPVPDNLWAPAWIFSAGIAAASVNSVRGAVVHQFFSAMQRAAAGVESQWRGHAGRPGPSCCCACTFFFGMGLPPKESPTSAFIGSFQGFRFGALMVRRSIGARPWARNRPATFFSHIKPGDTPLQRRGGLRDFLFCIATWASAGATQGKVIAHLVKANMAPTDGTGWHYSCLRFSRSW